jgi:hypothetical protein
MMKMLYVVLLLCIGALIWSAWRVASHVKKEQSPLPAEPAGDAGQDTPPPASAEFEGEA